MRCSLRGILLLPLIFLLLPFYTLASDRSSATIFFLGSGSADTPWTQLVSQGVIEKLNQSGLPYTYHIDHLEAARFDELKQYDLMLRYLKEKYSGREPDIFIAAGPAASNFSLRYPNLFASSKRILIQSGEESSDRATLIDAEIEHSLMVREMVRLSNPNKVFIVGDSVQPSDKYRLSSITSALDQVKVRYEILENKSLPDLLTAVSKLPNESAIFYAPIYRRFEGKGLAPAYVLKKLHQVSRSPIYSSSDSTLGFGIVGGYLYSPSKLGFMAGEAVDSLVSGEAITFTQNGFGYAYDWNEVTRWGYQGLINQEANILFKSPSLWQQHKGKLIFITLFSCILLLLSTVLVLINRQLIKTKNILSRERLLLEERVEERTKELSFLHKQAVKMARIDVLTELPNRRAFFEKGEVVHYQAERYHNRYSIMMFDIDLFKNINDIYGHPAGDKVIQKVAKTIQSQIRKSDLAARIGGEEFAVIMSEAKHDQLHFLAERVRYEIAETPVFFEGNLIKASVSIGIAEYQADDQGIESILSRADKALYQAKQTGRNKVVIYSDD
ncbi:diguanylate cyclase [Amphritea sp. HPY]|uniref:diguanylate cyclase n=1 Tax=Amphritea sp. HPY TaxID=3421652 RepID=UPI003D7D8EF3